MRYVLLTLEPDMREAFLSPEAFLPSDDLKVVDTADEALEAMVGADMVFIDLIATLDEPNKIAGYERFAMAKMGNEAIAGVPLVLIEPPRDYDFDFMVGWPDFVFARVPRPVTAKIFRRASTWI